VSFAAAAWQGVVQQVVQVPVAAAGLRILALP
jgi:hypothetical protein